jgi:DNA invertase Pin-like site-specific DNA recombinase
MGKTNKGKTGKKSGAKAFSYLRVSTDGQDTSKNKTAVRAFANQKSFPSVRFVEERLSGKIPWKERKIKDLIDRLRPHDKLILPELSRLGRSSLEVMEMLAVLKEKNVAVYDIKNRWELNGSLQSEVMAFCFSIAARIERDLLLQRCKEGREAAKARGVKFGRPSGPGKSKLDKYEEEIVALLKTGSRQNYIAKKYGTTPANLCLWLKKKGLNNIRPEY